MEISITAWDADNTPSQLDPASFSLSDLDQHELVWLNLGGPDTQPQREFLEERIGLPRLAVDDALRDRHPPKFESLEDGWDFLLVRGLDASTDSIDFHTIQLSFFWKGSLLVTRHNAPSVSVQSVTQRIQEGKIKKPRNGGQLSHTLLRTLADRYMPIVLQLESRLEEIEDLLMTQPSDTLLGELLEYSRQLKRLRRIAGYHENCYKRMLSQEVLPGDMTHSELVDLHESAERLNSLSTLQYEITSDLINGYLSISSHRLNQVMRVLTVVTVLFVPLSFMAGIYGMNFNYIPELQFKYGYFVLLGVMATITTGLLIAFRKKHWL